MIYFNCFYHTSKCFNLIGIPFPVTECTHEEFEEYCRDYLSNKVEGAYVSCVECFMYNRENGSITNFPFTSRSMGFVFNEPIKSEKEE